MGLAEREFLGSSGTYSSIDDVQARRESWERSDFDFPTSSSGSVRANDFLVELETALEEEEISFGSSSAQLCEEFFLALPSNIPVPEISIDPDGEVSFDWCGGQNWVISISFSEKNRFSFATLQGPDETHGARWWFGMIPSDILGYVRKVCEQGQVA